MKTFIAGCLFALAAGASALACADLSGVWTADDGGRYYLRQIGSQLVWFGEEKSTNPRFANVFTGRVAGNKIRGSWQDVPKGDSSGRGELSLAILDGGNTLLAEQKSGGFGGSRWNRADAQNASTPAVTAQIQLTPEPIASARLKEDCIDFNTRNARADRIRGSWKIVDGSHWVFDFGNRRAEAYAALRVIHHHKADQSCFVGRPNPSFTYLLSNGRAPAGKLDGEDCLRFDPGRTQVRRIDGRWKIVDGSHWIYDFKVQKEAQQALAVIQKYGFTHACFVGRPNPGLNYLRR